MTTKLGSLPAAWKSSIITMIPKKVANSKNPKDYRPISLTSCISKVCEKLVKNQLNEFLKRNNLIIKQQSGFRAHRQIRDNIFHLSQKILESFNRKKKVCTIFFDIASAFDKVWHDGLIYKLIKLNCPVYLTMWIKDFLKDRTFEVRVNNCLSIKYNITAGTPQGACLSPILFSIYINDMPCNYKSNSLLFADDLASSHIFKKFGRIENQINAYLKTIEKWLCKWRLLMAPTKCSFLVFSKNNTSESSKLSLKLFGEILPVNDDPTFRGIRFDNHLTFNNQLAYLQSTRMQRMSILRVVSNRSWGLSVKTRELLYQTLIRSVVEYSSILFPCLSTSGRNKIEKIQNNCIKIIHNKSKFSSTTEVLQLTNIVAIEERFNALNLNYLKNCFIFNNELIIDLYKEFKNFSGGRQIEHKTLFCHYIEELNVFSELYL